jgi:hypothetical protein
MKSRKNRENAVVLHDKVADQRRKHTHLNKKINIITYTKNGLELYCNMCSVIKYATFCKISKHRSYLSQLQLQEFVLI